MRHENGGKVSGSQLCVPVGTLVTVRVDISFGIPLSAAGDVMDDMARSDSATCVLFSGSTLPLTVASIAKVERTKAYDV